MPLLARMLATPLVVDVRPGAVKDLPELLADQRISTSGRVAVAFGRSGREVVDSGAELAPRPAHVLVLHHQRLAVAKPLDLGVEEVADRRADQLPVGDAVRARLRALRIIADLPRVRRSS